MKTLLLMLALSSQAKAATIQGSLTVTGNNMTLNGSTSTFAPSGIGLTVPVTLKSSATINSNLGVTGNVGIGMTNPSSLLELNSGPASNYENGILRINNGTGVLWRSNTAVSATRNWLLQSNTLANGDFGLYRSTAVTVLNDQTGYTKTIYSTNSGGVTILGTNTNDSAAAGYVGEIISSTLGGNQTPGASSSNVAISTITLTAGDWDIYGSCDFVEGATTAGTILSCGISTSNSSKDTVAQNNYAITSHTLIANDEDILSPGPRRVQIASTTTYYLVATVTYTVLGGGVWSNGSTIITARRMR